MCWLFAPTSPISSLAFLTRQDSHHDIAVLLQSSFSALSHFTDEKVEAQDRGDLRAVTLSCSRGQMSVQERVKPVYRKPLNGWSMRLGQW